MKRWTVMRCVRVWFWGVTVDALNKLISLVAEAKSRALLRLWDAEAGRSRTSK